MIPQFQKIHPILGGGQLTFIEGRVQVATGGRTFDSTALVHKELACPLNKSQLALASLDFVINRFFMKLYNTNRMETVKACQEYFSFELPSIQLGKRKKTFETKFMSNGLQYRIYVVWCWLFS